MGKTFLQLADEAMAAAKSVSAEEAIRELGSGANVLLVDVRDKEEVAVTGIGVGAINAPGRSIAWIACPEFDEQYREILEVAARTAGKGNGRNKRPEQE